jgi:molecular chaperone GrpE (heat shock protein)
MDYIDEKIYAMNCQPKPKTMGGLLDSLTKPFTDLAKGVANITKDITKSVSNVASEVASLAKKGVTQAYDIGSEAVQGVSSVASTALSNPLVSTGLTGYLTSLGVPPQVASMLTQSGGSLLSNIASGKNILTEAIPSTLVQTAIPTLQQYATGSAVDSLSSLASQYAPQLASAVQSGQSALTSAGVTAQNYANYYNPQQALAEAMSKAGTTVSTAANTQISDMKASIMSALYKLKMAFQTLGQNVDAEYIQDAIDMATSTGSYVKAIETAIYNIQTRAGQHGGASKSTQDILDTLNSLKSSSSTLGGSMNNKLALGQALNSAEGYIDLDYFYIFKALMNDPKAILAIIKFGDLDKSTSDLATSKYVNTQKVLSLMRGGMSPIKVAQRGLSGASWSGLSFLADSVSLSKAHATGNTVAAELLGLKGTFRFAGQSADAQFIQDAINSINSGVSYPNAISTAIANIKARARASSSGVPNATTQSVLDKLADLKEKYTTTSAITKPSSIVASQLSTSSKPITTTSMIPSITQQLTQDAQSGILQPTTSLRTIPVAQTSSLTQALQAESDASKTLDTDQALRISRLVSTSALNKIKTDSMSKVSQLAKKLAQADTKKIQEVVNDQSKENTALKSELTKITSQYNQAMDKFRDAQVNQSSEQIKFLERKNAELTEKLINALSSIDKALNKAELLKSALDKILEDSKDTASIDYKNLATINKQFKDQIALFNSLGIKNVLPESITYVYDLLTTALKSNPNYLSSLNEEKSTISQLASRINALPTADRMSGYTVNNPITATMLGAQRNYERRGIRRPIQMSGIDSLMSQRDVANSLLGQEDTASTMDAILNTTVNKQNYPYVNALMKLAIAGYLLEMGRQMEVVHPEYAQYMFVRLQLKNQFENYKLELEDVIKSYMANKDIFDINAEGYVSAMSEKLSNLILKADNYIKSLVFREPRFLNAVNQLMTYDSQVYGQQVV